MQKLSSALRPDCINETSEEYFQRISPILPNFPLDVVSQWLYSHFDSVMQRYSWLDFSLLKFSLEMWKTDKILQNINAWNEMAVESWKSGFLNNSLFQDSRLGKYMITMGTWPIPPIVFNNVTEIKMPDGSMIAEWELIEGHHRLAYLRAIESSMRWKSLTEHSLWIIHIE